MFRNIVIGLGLTAVAASSSLAATLGGDVTATGKRTNADAVVFIEAIDGMSFDAPTEHAKMDQVRMIFTPRVLPVVVGTTVDFFNSDPVAHNVMTIDDCADMFDLGTWTTGESRSYKFEKECGAVILCNVHPEMEAYVVAVPTPYFAVTDDKGAYEITDIPDGTYTVTVWHPELKKTSQEVVVEGSAAADFVLKK